MKLRVQCYSGWKDEGRPADDGNLYILRRRTTETDEGWSLEAFREVNS